MSVTSEDVHNIRFPLAPFGTRGYNEVQVDDFLDRVAATLDGEDDITAAEVHQVTFALAPLGKRAGYDQASVDAFLRTVEATLAARARTVAPAGPYIAPALEHSHARRPLWRRVRR
ncbi:DivIVA domain-containing protein [Prauserella muralis]|uniref:Cell wall synthesis protein Wag31 n=1 Tax=Prauserella muralis TaxID=588067 RepID=A0A2V4AZB6_9PSEU|nr:DivIVA domain-containing protein [Prauserella muralis]PXY21280.1 cell division protein DivIVA [Prauserella muralis]TWE30397.1 DivIVA domain-containing protein [Prauserella muralis]